MTSSQMIGVIGAGTMGNGIAQVCAMAGLWVAMIDIDDAAVSRGRTGVPAGGGAFGGCADVVAPAAGGPAVSAPEAGTPAGGSGAGGITGSARLATPHWPRRAADLRNCR